MTTFQKDSFTITIPTGGDPVENWMDLISEIGSIFSMLTPETINRCDGLYNLAVLLQALVPDYDTAQRMTKGAAAATSTDDAATPKTHTPPLGALLDDLQRLGEENGRLRERLRIMEEQASRRNRARAAANGPPKRWDNDTELTTIQLYDYGNS